MERVDVTMANYTAMYDPTQTDPRLVTLLPLQFAGKDLDEVIEALRSLVVSRAEMLLRENIYQDIPYIIVDLPKPLFAVKHSRYVCCTTACIATTRFRSIAEIPTAGL